jgi:phage-related baseplate assembly protein
VALYQLDILAALTQTGIQQTAAGGKARAFCDIVGDQLGTMETNEFLNLGETLIHYATGQNLDFIGEIFGVYRLGQQIASISQGDLNFKFYVAGGGKFGDINSGQSINLPAGTLIRSAADNGPIFITDTAYTLHAADTQQYVGAYAAAPGNSANASAGVFNQWSGTVPYSKSAFGSLLVTNSYGVVGGRDAETDDNYRYRIQQKLQGRNGSNEAALRFELLQVPGIQDIVFTRLAGTFDCYVYGIAPTPAPSLLDAVQQTINDNVAFPLTGTAIAPDLVGISLVTTLSMSAGASTTDQDMVIGEAVAAAQDYIDNLGVGQQLVSNEIADRIRNADARILDVGQPNKQIPEIFIWRSRDDGTRYSRSKLEYSFISCFITSPPTILVELPE